MYLGPKKYIGAYFSVAMLLRENFPFSLLQINKLNAFIIIAHSLLLDIIEKNSVVNSRTELGMGENSICCSIGEGRNHTG